MWVLLAGCQEPFGADRHDLVGFRIAAIAADPVADGGVARPRAALVVDGRLFAEAPTELSWWVLDSADGLAAEPPRGEPAATGPRPALAIDGARTVYLEARDADGAVERAFLELATPPASGLGPLAGFRVTAGDPTTITALPTSGDPWVRFLATAGTFREVDRLTARWRPPAEDGPVTLLGLALGDVGETTFRAAELRPPPDAVSVHGRAVPVVDGPEVPPGLALRATLVADRASPVGFRLEDAEVVDPGEPGDPNPCSGDDPLDPDLFVDQGCTLDAVDGRRVVVVPTGAP